MDVLRVLCNHKCTVIINVEDNPAILSWIISKFIQDYLYYIYFVTKRVATSDSSERICKNLGRVIYQSDTSANHAKALPSIRDGPSPIGLLDSLLECIKLTFTLNASAGVDIYDIILYLCFYIFTLYYT